MFFGDVGHIRSFFSVVPHVVAVAVYWVHSMGLISFRELCSFDIDVTCAGVLALFSYSATLEGEGELRLPR